jgi:UDP-GlcNAc3NAcA epimerase
VRIASITGTRPQFIKAAAVSESVRQMPGLEEILIHTGQHYDPEMTGFFFTDLGLPVPAYNLQVHSGSHGAQTGRMLERLEEVLEREKPDWVIVYGDTNSTLAGALAAAKLHIRLAHVEAGLRSFDRRMPEEVNRVLTDHVSDLLLAPTTVAVQNLQREGIAGPSVHLVGDVMYDSFLQYTARALGASSVLHRLCVEPRNYVLATIHRAGNTDDRVTLSAIFHGLLEVAATVPVVFPIHPRTRKSLRTAGLLDAAEQNLRVIDPVGYFDMLVLEHHACLIATDSGGVQKEAFFHGVPCVTLRPETEWTELVESGWNRVVPPLNGNVGTSILAALAGKRPGERPNYIFGDGNAAGKIAALLVDHG